MGVNSLFLLKTMKKRFWHDILAVVHLHVVLLGQKPPISTILESPLNYGSSFEVHANYCHDFLAIFGFFFGENYVIIKEIEV